MNREPRTGVGRGSRLSSGSCEPYTSSPSFVGTRVILERLEVGVGGLVSVVVLHQKQYVDVRSRKNKSPVLFFFF